MALQDLTTRVALLEAAVRELAKRLAAVPLRQEHRGLPFEMRLGMLADDLHPGNVATVNIYAGEPGNETPIEGFNVEAWDWLMHDCQSGVLIAAGTRVLIARILGTWYVIAASCCVNP